MSKKTIFWLNEITPREEFLLGGKIISLYQAIPLAETCSMICIPKSFVISIEEFHHFLLYNQIADKIEDLLKKIINDDIKIMQIISEQIHTLIINSSFALDTQKILYQKYIQMTGQGETLAVRSSSCDEDGSEHSFAGQQNSYLHIITFEDLLTKIKLVYASLYGVHAISYRLSKKISLLKAKMAVCVQHMIRSDIGTSGVMFTQDPHSNNNAFISISANYGLGESIVQGTSNPDEYIVFKSKSLIIQKNKGSKKHKVIYHPNGNTTNALTTENEKNSFCLEEKKIIFLSEIGKKIENYFGYAVDIEWAWDGMLQSFYILQIRAITAKQVMTQNTYDYYTINKDIKERVILTGKAIGKKVVTGKVKIINQLDDINTIHPGDILVTNITNPHWEPAMKRCAGIITNLGGRTCHAAIIARELEIPAIVGTNIATQILQENQEVTLVCCQGDTGYICSGYIPFHIEKRTTQHILPHIKHTKIMLNIGNPNIAFENAMMASAGVGLTRMEYIINNYIGIHPLAIVNYDKLDTHTREEINKKIIGYSSPSEFFITKLIEGLGTIAAAFYPRAVTIRLSDFKTNEYRNLFGGSAYEPVEENPMLGYRGAMRYLSDQYSKAFLLEIQAIYHLIHAMKLHNIALLIPFVRTPSEARKVIQLLAQNGICRSDTLKIYIMCEIPSNVILADEFLDLCDGFSIGSNDLTQLTLGIDRDGNKLIQEAFDENNDAVKKMIALAIQAAKKKNKYIGICGQGPSDNIDFAIWLIKQKIDSISLVPDSFFQFYELLETKMHGLVKKENRYYYNNK